MPIVAEYQKALAKYGADLPSTYSAIECYIAAKLAVEGLKGAGPNPTRRKFVGALESLKDHDLAGSMFATRPPTTRVRPTSISRSWPRAEGS